MSKWQFYDCIDGCGEKVYAAKPSRCIKCRERYWSKTMHKKRKNWRYYDYMGILKFVAKFKQDNAGLSPSTRDIMRGCDIPSTSVVRYILRDIEDDGLIELGDGTRNIKIVGERYNAPKELLE